MPNLYAFTSSGDTPRQRGIGTTSTKVLDDTPSRQGLVMVNLSDGTVYIAFGNSAVVGSGIAILPFGGAFTMSDYTFSKEIVEAIAQSAASHLAVQEFLHRP